MNLVLQSLRSFPVTIGELTLYLSEYQISETATLKESGTAGGSLVLSGCWPKGSRISLKGKLSPSLSPPDRDLYALTGTAYGTDSPDSESQISECHAL